MRQLLAPVLNRSENEIRFDHLNGKPLIHRCPVSFNLAHSGDLALVAVSKAPRVGIDIETLSAKHNLTAIARHVFHPTEIALLNGKESDARAQFFFEMWVRKEAVVKLLGQSVFQSRDLMVADTMGKGGRVPLPGETDTSAWILPVKVSSRYVAAVAIESHLDRIPKVRVHEWDG